MYLNCYGSAVHPMMYKYHISFVHPPADGHLGCFPGVALLSCAAAHLGVHVSRCASHLQCAVSDTHAHTAPRNGKWQGRVKAGGRGRKGKGVGRRMGGKQWEEKRPEGRGGVEKKADASHLVTNSRMTVSTVYGMLYPLG